MISVGGSNFDQLMKYRRKVCLWESYRDIGWWLFVLEKHPSRALKCGLADWYMKQGGEENREKALKLLAESVKEGLGFARDKLAAL